MSVATQENVPTLRFPEFSGGWKAKILGEIASFSSGGTPSKSIADYWGEGIPWISAISMHTDRIEKSERCVTREGAKNGTKIAEINTVLLLVRGSMLFNRIPAGICVTPVAFNQDVKALSIVGNNSPYFLLFYIRAHEQRLLSLVTGTGIGAGKLDTDELKALPYPQAPLLEQQKIASFLLTVDEKIEQLIQEKVLLERYKKGMMQKIFSQEIRFKDDNGNPFPDWEEEKLGDLGEFKNGINKDKSDFGFGVPFINLMDVFGKPSIDSSIKLDLVNATEGEVKNYSLEAGDVIFIRSSVKKSGVGETSVILKNLPNTVFSGFLIRFRETSSKLHHSFMVYCFWVQKFRNLLISLSTTSANTNINQESLKLILVRFPSDIKEQQKIADFLSSIDDKINLVATELSQAQTFKKGLLQQMFV